MCIPPLYEVALADTCIMPGYDLASAVASEVLVEEPDVLVFHFKNLLPLCLLEARLGFRERK